MNKLVILLAIGLATLTTISAFEFKIREEEAYVRGFKPVKAERIDQSVEIIHHSMKARRARLAL